MDIINQFDHNKDGYIEADEILKVSNKRFFSYFVLFLRFSSQVLEIIGNEKVKISKKHLKEIIDVVRKEHIVEEIEKKEEMEAKVKQDSATKSTTDTKNI